MRFDQDSGWQPAQAATTPSAAQQEFYDPLSLSLKAIGCGLWDYDIDADILSCDARWYEIMGIDQKVMEVRTISDLLRNIHPEDVGIASEIDSIRLKGLLANDESYRVEFRIIRPSREIRCIRSVACIIRDPVSRHLRAVGSITDITEFRTAALKSRMSALLSYWKSVNSSGECAQSEGKYNPLSTENTALETYALSERQRECLLWVSVGKTAWETALILGRSPRTVEFHLRNAVKKLGASNKVHAAAMAIRLGLL